MIGLSRDATSPPQRDGAMAPLRLPLGLLHLGALALTLAALVGAFAWAAGRTAAASEGLSVDATPLWDLWSLGEALVWAMLGVAAWRGGSAQRLIAAALSQTLPVATGALLGQPHVGAIATTVVLVWLTLQAARRRPTARARSGSLIATSSTLAAAAALLVAGFVIPRTLVNLADSDLPALLGDPEAAVEARQQECADNAKSGRFEQAAAAYDAAAWSPLTAGVAHCRAAFALVTGGACAMAEGQIVVARRLLERCAALPCEADPGVIAECTARAQRLTETEAMVGGEIASWLARAGDGQVPAAAQPVLLVSARGVFLGVERLGAVDEPAVAATLEDRLLRRRSTVLMLYTDRAATQATAMPLIAALETAGFAVIAATLEPARRVWYESPLEPTDR